MKNIIKYIILGGVCWGCTQVDLSANQNSTSTLEVNINSPQTKTTEGFTTTDTKISEIVLFVFDAQSNYTEHIHSATATEISNGKMTVEVSTGIKHLHIVANPQGADLSRIASREELKESGMDLADFNDSLFTMVGTQQNVEINPNTTNTHTLELERMAGRVWVQEITNSCSVDFLLDSVYFLGATATASHWDCAPNSTNTYDRMLSGFEFQNFDVFDYPVEVSDCSSFSDSEPMGVHYYLYENTSIESPTRLVITGTMDNRRVYYTLALCGAQTLKHNHHYSITLEITGTGAETPDIGLVGGVAVVSLEPWMVVHNDVIF